MSTAIVAGDRLTHPPQGVHRLLALSAAPTWPAAQREWSLTGASEYEGDPDFVGYCELCHQPRVKVLHRLENALTGHGLWLGQECIIRWRLLDGSGTEADNRRLWQLRQARLRDEQLFRAFGAADPLTPALVSRYRQAVRRYFGAEWSGAGPLPPAVWDRLVELTTGHSPRESSLVLDRIRLALFNPRALGLRRSREAASPSPAPQRAPRVRTTLARGAHTQDPSAPYR